MQPDLKSMTRKELEKLKANIEKALIKVAAKEKKAAIAAAEKAVAAHGFSLAEITGEAKAEKPARKSKPGPKKKAPPKYRDPSNSEKTWTGKGRQPDWFKSAILAGKSPEELEI